MPAKMPVGTRLVDRGQRLNFLIEREEAERIKTAALKRHQSMSEYIRAVMIRETDRELGNQRRLS